MPQGIGGMSVVRPHRQVISSKEDCKQGGQRPLWSFRSQLSSRRLKSTGYRGGTKNRNTPMQTTVQQLPTRQVTVVPSTAIHFFIHHCTNSLLPLTLGNPNMRKRTAHTITRMPSAIPQVLAKFVTQKLRLPSDIGLRALKARHLASRPATTTRHRNRHAAGGTRAEMA